MDPFDRAVIVSLGSLLAVMVAAAAGAYLRDVIRMRRRAR